MKSRILFAAMLGCLLLLSSPNHSIAQNIVVPNSLANVEGNANNGFPFNIGDFNISTQRYQQDYASNQFSAITGPTLITAISFRPDSSTGSAFNSTLTNIQINLSTTTIAPSGLSTTYASNIGGDDTQVYSGSLTLSSTNTGGPPRNFDIVITLQTPFLYDPALGNLLMDVRNFGGGITTQFNADSSDGSIGRVWNTDVNSATGTINTSGNGLVTQFTFAAVPEPTTWALIGVGTFGAGAFAWRKKRLATKAGMAKLTV